MVPPWADEMPGQGGEGEEELPDQPGDDNPADAEDPSDPATSDVVPPSPIAPSRRFGGARGRLGAFAKDGDGAKMRRGVAQYVSKGYGGAKTAARRFGGTARTAGDLFGALSAEGGSSAEASGLDVQGLQGKSVNEVINAVVEAVRPIDGSQDTEAARESINDALSELLVDKPEVNLLELDIESRLFVVERFLVSDLYRRVFLDIGKHIQDRAPSATVGLQRLRQVKDYVRESLGSAFRGVLNDFENLSRPRITALSKSILLDTLEVFEGYA